MVAVVVPLTMAKPQDFSNIFSSLTAELTNIANAQAQQAQSGGPGLRLSPSRNSLDGNRYYYVLSNNPQSGFASISGTRNPLRGIENFETVNVRFANPNGKSSAGAELSSSNTPVSVVSGVVSR